ncbi:vWA domain-containing protein, partial [Jiangella alba]
TRIDAAKDALRQVIAGLPDDQEVGLRVYGAEVFSQNDPGACTDSQLIAAPDTGNRDALTAALDDYEPYGETPIGHALQEAGKDLGTEGPRTIVLVSDGEPTCAPDPCEVATQLAGDGVDVRIDVVGLDVDEAARDKLRCIADNGHGTYYDAKDADDLVRSLDTSTTRASR